LSYAADKEMDLNILSTPTDSVRQGNKHIKCICILGKIKHNNFTTEYVYQAKSATAATRTQTVHSIIKLTTTH